MNQRVIDFTVQGKCSGCGACCTDFLPVSEAEILQIRGYVKKNGIKAHTVASVVLMESLDMTCPFRNNAEQKCDIYRVRPQICRSFMCNYTPGDIVRNREKFAERYMAVSMRDVIFGDPVNREYVRAMWRAMSVAVAGRELRKRRGAWISTKR